jgi:hypothetical protein
MAERSCPRCNHAVDPSWKLCPFCGAALTSKPAARPTEDRSHAGPLKITAPDASPVVRLACPACGGALPLPAANIEYLPCPFCASSLRLRRAAGEVNLELAEQVGRKIGQQVGQQMDAKFRLQQAQIHQIHAEQAYAQGQIRPAVLNWIRAYELAPDYQPAAVWLRQFVGTHQNDLLGPLGVAPPGLSSQDRQVLQELRSDPTRRRASLPPAPDAPPALGKLSLALLRKISPTRAAVIESMYAERVAQYEAQRTQHEAERKTITAKREQSIREWQERNQAIRRDAPLMARLCLSVVEEAERRLQEEIRRRQEEERQRQIALAQEQKQQLNQIQNQVQEMNRRERRR